MQQNGDEDQNAELRVDQRGDGNRYAIEERMHQQRPQAGNRCMVRQHGFFVGLFAKMKVRRDGVLDKLNQHVAGQHPEHWIELLAVRPLFHAFGDQFDEDSGQHKARAERDQVTQRHLSQPARRHQKPAQKVRRRRRQPIGRDEQCGLIHSMKLRHSKSGTIAYLLAVRQEHSFNTPAACLDRAPFTGSSTHRQPLYRPRRNGASSYAHRISRLTAPFI